MPQLTERCDLYRMAVNNTDHRKEMALLIAAVPCLRVPVSSFDKVANALSSSTGTSSPSEYFHSEARASTDVFLLPEWAAVRPEDELRRGRYTDNNGDVVPFRYVIDGIRDYETFGYQQTIAVFCTLET